MSTTHPGECSICASPNWAELYRGHIRVGRFGCLSPREEVVWLCNVCGAGFLPCATEDYESSDYRTLVDGEASTASFHQLHDPEQGERLALCGTADLRGRVVADVGCGAGSFLDLVAGMAGKTLAIEPTRAFHDGLRASGHEVFPYADAARPVWEGRVERAFCFSVLEHVQEPLAFLRDIRALLAPGGTLWLSTPNRGDWLLELLGADYARFFYRQVHRWYFDRASLEALARRAGFAGVEVRHQHRFDFANLLLWVRDRRPSGKAAVPVPPALEVSFRQALVDSGRSDYLYARLSA